MKEKRWDGRGEMTKRLNSEREKNNSEGKSRLQYGFNENNQKKKKS